MPEEFPAIARFFLRTTFFDDAERMIRLIEKYGRVERLDPNTYIGRRTHADSIDEIEDMVSTYRSAARRKGVPTKLAHMISAGEPLPMPIIMKRNGGTYVVGGNTRLNVCEVLDVTPQPRIVFVDLDQPEIKKQLDELAL